MYFERLIVMVCFSPLFSSIQYQYFFIFFVGNHHIDFKEFLIAFTLTSVGDPVEKLNYTFSLFDEDGSETIEPNEMFDLLTKLFSITGHTIAVTEIQFITDDIFRKFDIDQNQTISKEEFIDGCLKHNAIHQILSPF